MVYDVIVIGAGLSGLTAASLLTRRGLRVLVLEQERTPGGACGIFKREGAVFDKGVAMLYGFGEKGFNSHRFLFNCLEEPFQVVKHDLLYVVNYKGKRIHFWPDIEQFVEELSEVFPKEKENIRRFYEDMKKMYTHVISEHPNYTTPDETNPKSMLSSIAKHPLSYLKFISYMNISTEKLLKNYFTDPDLLKFFNKLTSTYCYATIQEAPAILASVMFVDNHEGGSYYPLGSTLFLPGKLEKVIETHGGEIRYDCKVKKIIFDRAEPVGVLLESGERIFGEQIIYSGTVWDLYENVLSRRVVLDKELEWVRSQEATYPSVVLYTLVDSAVIPEDASPIEMLANDSDKVDENELTIYIMSLDDKNLCGKDQHTLVAVGPSFREWSIDREEYDRQKQEEIDRILTCLSKRFRRLTEGLLYCELGTPKTIERYTLKKDGSAAGPKQMLGQHMLQRQGIRTNWENLFCCGESTTMGTGTPTVTTSGIAAANAVLKDRGLRTYVWEEGMDNYVEVIKAPVQEDWLEKYYPKEEAQIMGYAGKCFFCREPSCCNRKVLDMPAIMRRVACGNFVGAKKIIKQAVKDAKAPYTERFISMCEKNCIQNRENKEQDRPMEIRQILDYVKKYKYQ